MLTIYEKHPTADAYRVGGFYSPYALVATEKRFSDAELAAEAYKAKAEHLTAVLDYYPGETCMRAYSHQETLRRFATLPHFDA